MESKLVQFNSPEELLKAFDKAWQGDFNTRTDAILDLMRDYVQAQARRRAQKEKQGGV